MRILDVLQPGKGRSQLELIKLGAVMGCTLTEAEVHLNKYGAGYLYSRLMIIADTPKNRGRLNALGIEYAIYDGHDLVFRERLSDQQQEKRVRMRKRERERLSRAAVQSERAKIWADERATIQAMRQERWLDEIANKPSRKRGGKADGLGDIGKYVWHPAEKIRERSVIKFRCINLKMA